MQGGSSPFNQNNVWFPRPSAAEITAGTSQEVRAWSPADIAGAIAALAVGTPPGSEGELITYDASNTAVAQPASYTLTPLGTAIRNSMNGWFGPQPLGTTTVVGYGTMTNPVATGTVSAGLPFLRYSSASGAFGVTSGTPGASDYLPFVSSSWFYAGGICAIDSFSSAGGDFFSGVTSGNVPIATACATAAAGIRLGIGIAKNALGETTWQVIDSDGGTITRTDTGISERGTIWWLVYRDYTNPIAPINVGWKVAVGVISASFATLSALDATPVPTLVHSAVNFASASSYMVYNVGNRTAGTPNLLLANCFCGGDPFGFRTGGF